MREITGLPRASGALAAPGLILQDQRNAQGLGRVVVQENSHSFSSSVILSSCSMQAVWDSTFLIWSSVTLNWLLFLLQRLYFSFQGGYPLFQVADVSIKVCMVIFFGVDFRALFAETGGSALVVPVGGPHDDTVTATNRVSRSSAIIGPVLADPVMAGILLKAIT